MMYKITTNRTGKASFRDLKKGALKPGFLFVNEAKARWSAKTDINIIKKKNDIKDRILVTR